jgi:predicted nucleic acid-binding protein
MSQEFILDNCVNMAWLFGDGLPIDVDYATTVLEAFTHEVIAHVPPLWFTETSHVLIRAEKKKLITAIEAVNYVNLLRKLPIQTDHESPESIQLMTMTIARECDLTGYDAQYLELAHRKQLPIATLDKKLRAAAEKVNVPIYLL